MDLIMHRGTKESGLTDSANGSMAKDTEPLGSTTKGGRHVGLDKMCLLMEVRLACMGMRSLCGKSIMGSGQTFGPLGWPAAHKREEGVCTVSDAHETNHESHACCRPGYASPEEAMKAEREKVLYTVALYVGTEVEQPDYLASVDVDPESPTYSRVVERTPMPNVGDELHHFGWNACSSCHDNESKSRRFLVVPGERSGRIHIIDTQDERAPKMHKVIE